VAAIDERFRHLLKMLGGRLEARRIRDIVMAVGLLIASSPLIAVAAIAVRVGMGRPVLFRQQRAGLRGRPFTILKLRTMREPDAVGEGAVGDEERLTRIGSILRRTSVDELPQLWNVVRGDMSMVGPRPYPLQYLTFYTPEQSRRLEVKPGLTGLAQVGGRNALSWDERLALDTEYVAQRSAWLDTKILVRTIGQVLGGRGISTPGYTTSPGLGSAHSSGEVGATECDSGALGHDREQTQTSPPAERLP